MQNPKLLKRLLGWFGDDWPTTLPATIGMYWMIDSVDGKTWDKPIFIIVTEALHALPGLWCNLAGLECNPYHTIALCYIKDWMMAHPHARWSPILPPVKK